MKETLIPVEDFRTLKAGDTVRCVQRWGHHHWKFTVGRDYQVAQRQHCYGLGLVYVPVDEEGDRLGAEDFGHKFVRVVTEGQVGSTSAAQEKAAVRYVYVISDEFGFINSSPDREEAREIKARLGGKREGVIITAYAPVKEIR